MRHATAKPFPRSRAVGSGAERGDAVALGIQEFERLTRAPDNRRAAFFDGNFEHTARADVDTGGGDRIK
ncbi:MAG: hypothetical protein AAFY49_15130, partial [Pseudomonadota bacterium]